MKDDRFYGLAEGWAGFLVLLDGFAHVGCEPWCSRALRRDLVAAIIQWITARAGAIGGPEWTGVGLNVLYAQMVCTALGCREGYRPGIHYTPHVSGGPSMTALQTAFGHRPIHESWIDPMFVEFSILSRLESVRFRST